MHDPGPDAMHDEIRPPTPVEVIAEQQRLQMTNEEFAHLLGVSRGSTISDWKAGRYTPKITYAEMRRRIGLHTGRTDASEQGRRDREYTAALIALIKGDAQDIAASARRQLDKLEVAERFLTGQPSPAPVSLAVEREESQALQPDAGARRGKSRRRQGHR